MVTYAGVRVGTERVTVSRPSGGFRIAMTGQIGPPFDLLTTKFDLTYAADWHPQQLTVEGALRNALDNDASVETPVEAAVGNMAPTLASTLHRKAGGSLRIVPID